MERIPVVHVIDIAVVTILVAAVLVWVRRIRVGRVASGLLAVVALYLVARSAGLSLLSGLFEGSFALFILIAVVIFQKELRRLFETISWPGFAQTSRVTSQHGLDLLAETLFDFAGRRIGALVVLPGKEALEPHVSGGIDLQGKLSRPLLQSLFDPHSPGHDGAAVIDGDRIARFAVHLPLSTNERALVETGTRHAAALGLSEHCDALCLVVSEERGSVSAARNGELAPVRGVPELRAILEEASVSEAKAASSEAGFPVVLRRYWVEGLVSLGVVVALWVVLVSGSIETEQTYDLPVVLADIPPALSLESVEPERVSVTFRGTSSELARAKAGDFEISVDVALARIGQMSFSIREEDVHRPPSLDVIQIEPRRIQLFVTKR